MAQKAENITRPSSATTPQDVSVLRVHLAIDDLVETLVQDCFSTQETKKALDFCKWLRFYIPKTVKENFAV